MTYYLVRKRYFVPKDEVERYYGRRRDLSPGDVICEREWEVEEDDGNYVTPE